MKPYSVLFGLDVELIKNNARVAADIVVELEALEKSDRKCEGTGENAMKRPVS